MVSVGDRATDLTLKDHKGKKVTLSDFSGSRLLLSFHPLAWTNVCAQQMKALEDNYSKLEKLNTVPFGISVDSSSCKRAWRKELGIEKLVFLSDFWPHGELAASYGIFIEKEGVSQRANILIDEEQHVIFVKVYQMSQLPELEEIFRILR
ncbi:redoxin domain-containing protein [Methanomethylovorans sp.]|uniref:redoxin domain-containing protein n=1 Tax=Methanomethylovorans sp. TaxID=2758717 RepID=UPI00351C8418